MEPDKKPLFSPLVLTFHSAAFYREASWERSGRYLGYLLFLVVLLWIPRSAALYLTLADYASTGGEEIARQMPKVWIRQGKVTTDRPGVTEIRNPGDNVLLMVIDPEGRTKEVPGGKGTGTAAAGGKVEEPVFRVLSDRVEVALPGGGGKRILPLDGVDGFYADSAVFRDSAASFPADFTLLFTPLAIILSFAARYVEVRFLALAARGFADREGVPLDRDALVRLSVFAVTPAAVTRLGLDLIGLVVPFAFAMDFFASLAYVRFAVRSAGAPPAPAVPA